MVYYADIGFLINFCYDCLLLMCTQKLFHRKIKILKIICASCIGAVFSVAVQILNTSPFLKILLALLTSAVMLYICESSNNTFGFIKELFIFYSISMLFGGATFILNNTLSSLGHLNSRLFNTKNAFWVIIMGLIVYIFSLFVSKLVASKSISKSVEITVFNKNKSKLCNLLCDSGNLLCDPFSGLPVIVLKSKLFSELFDTDIDKISTQNVHNLKIRIIPVSTATGQGSMLGIKPEKIILNQNQAQINAIIASDGKNNNYNGLDGIIPLSLTT